MMHSEAEILRLSGVTAGYGETVVLEAVDFSLPPGGSISILGRNGVGKTTLLATMMGLTSLHGGRIFLAGQDISALPIYQRNGLGLGYVPQEREIFASLTVQENLLVAARPGAWPLERVFGIFPRLAERRNHHGNQLSGGEQQMLAVGRALMGSPAVLLLDEPSEGLAPLLVRELHRTVARLRDEEEMAIVMVEQKASLALAFAESCLVMDRGRIVYSGESAALRENPDRLNQLIGVAGST